MLLHWSSVFNWILLRAWEWRMWQADILWNKDSGWPIHGCVGFVLSAISSHLFPDRVWTPLFAESGREKVWADHHHHQKILHCRPSVQDMVHYLKCKSVPFCLLPILPPPSFPLPVRSCKIYRPPRAEYASALFYKTWSNSVNKTIM